MKKEPSDLWQDEFQSRQLTSQQEADIDEMTDDYLIHDFQTQLVEAMAPALGYDLRSEELGDLVRQCLHKYDRHALANLGEYLLILATDEAEEQARLELNL
tara:strand:+ start:78 stop:380 length:303 start_codon:yes stop_codon:yes gene_type:complete